MRLRRADPATVDLTHEIEEINDFLSDLDSRQVLDLIHHLRIEYAKELKELSEKYRQIFEEKMRSAQISNRAGVYLIVIVNPEGNVILYAGRTSGKSETSGLEFRIRDHVRLLGKTPLTVFIPNWWVRRIHTMIIEDQEVAKTLEKSLWMFLEDNKDKSPFKSLEELEEELRKIFSRCISDPNKRRIIELRPNLNPKPNFILKEPPAGQPRGLDRGK